MSDTVLQIIPETPTYTPSNDMARLATLFLRETLPESDRVYYKFLPTVEFFDPGTNLQQIKCPFCSDNLIDWWKKAMSTAWGDQFKLLSTTTPCCKRDSSLNNLNYIWQAGFASFALYAENPHVKQYKPEDLQNLSQLLETDLRLIWTRI